MKPYRLLNFRFEVSRHQTKALAIRAINRRIKAGPAWTGRTFDYEVRRNKKLIYARAGYL